MPIPAEFNFAVGVTVNILTTGPTFTGELIELVGNSLVVRLTTTTSPFTAGQVVRININEIIAIG